MTALGSHGGDVTVPCWALRPGGMECLSGIASAMPLWTLIRSINGDRQRPCLASETTLADSLGTSRHSVRRRLESLRCVRGLLLEIRRPRDGQRIPPLIRWATDPLALQVWWTLIHKVRINELAEQYGLGSEWMLKATRTLGRHGHFSKILAAQMRVELLSPPSSRTAQYGEGVGRGGVAIAESGPSEEKTLEVETRGSGSFRGGSCLETTSDEDALPLVAWCESCSSGNRRRMTTASPAVADA